MITRRKAVLGMGVAAVASAASMCFGFSEVLQPGLPTAGDLLAGGDAGADAIENRLAKEIARVAFRADSEEGVPVLLACMNQVMDKSTKTIPSVKVTAWNAVVTTEIHQNADAWQRLRPNCPPSDVGRLLQVLAERDVAAGGIEQRA